MDEKNQRKGNDVGHNYDVFILTILHGVLVAVTEDEIKWMA